MGGADAGPAAELANLMQEFAAEEAPAGVVGEIPAAAPAVAFDGRDFGARLATVAFNLIAARYGEHWRLERAEEKALADALAPLMNRLATKVEGVWLEVGVAVVVLTSVTYPRLLKSAELARGAELTAGATA